MYSPFISVQWGLWQPPRSQQEFTVFLSVSSVLSVRIFFFCHKNVVLFFLKKGNNYSSHLFRRYFNLLVESGTTKRQLMAQKHFTCKYSCGVSSVFDSDSWCGVQSTQMRKLAKLSLKKTILRISVKIKIQILLIICEGSIPAFSLNIVDNFFINLILKWKSI